MGRRNVFIAVVVALVWWAIPTPCFAQSAIAGVVRDATGGVLPGVTVTVSSPQQIGGVQTSVTDPQGVYRFPALRPGVYTMETTLSGFRSVNRTDIQLVVGATTTIDVSLTVASVRSSVLAISGHDSSWTSRRITT